MKTSFDILRTSRAIVVSLTKDLSLEQLQTIPKGFSNNILWNMTHLVVTQQLLHYRLAGLDCLIDDDLIDAFRKGTSPGEEITQEELAVIYELLVGLPDTLEEDYHAGVFEKYTPYMTSTGFELTSIESAIEFNNFHEGMHIGTIMALKKFV